MYELQASNNDQDVWDAFRKGDRAAFDGIYTRYFLSLFRYGTRFTADRNLVKDVIQDLFAELFANRSRLPPVRSTSSYLLVCMRRRLFRSGGLKFSTSEDNLSGSPVFCLELSPEEQIISYENRHSQKKRLAGALNRLTSRQREAVYLYFYENMGYQEIAAIMGMKEVKYARTLIYRAIAVLRKEIRPAESVLLYCGS